MTNDVMSPEQTILAVENDFAEMVKVNGNLDWKTESNYAIQLIYKNDYTTKIACANPVSVQNAVRNLGAIGLSLNPVLKHAYLVPRDGMICLDISYMGLMHLAQSTGSIMWAQCKIVHQADGYENRGNSVEPVHTYNAFGDRGPIVGAYCVVKLADGDFLTHEMQIADIYAIRDRSKAWTSKKSGPWKTDEKEMIRKTVVKQASKYWPKVERLDAAIHYLNQGDEGIDFDNERTQHSEHYKLAQQMIGLMSQEDGEGLVDFGNSIEGDDMEKVWRHLSAPDRRKINELIRAERASRAEEEKVINE